MDQGMSRALVEDQLSLDAAKIPYMNGEEPFEATIKWGSRHSIDLEFDPIHEQLRLSWYVEGEPFNQTIYLTTTGPNFGGSAAGSSAIRAVIVSVSSTGVRSRVALAAGGMGVARSA